MAKPRMYGLKTGYILNAKADMRHKPNIYQRWLEIAGNAEDRKKTALISDWIGNRRDIFDKS